jgi:hypothetical protein
MVRRINKGDVMSWGCKLTTVRRPSPGAAIARSIRIAGPIHRRVGIELLLAP